MHMLMISIWQPIHCIHTTMRLRADWFLSQGCGVPWAGGAPLFNRRNSQLANSMDTKWASNVLVDACTVKTSMAVGVDPAADALPAAYGLLVELESVLPTS